MPTADASPPPLHTWDVLVQGLVQGVGYRASARRQARALGVTGWVRNERDGSVRALIQHRDPAVLGEMVAWLRQGPPGAWVREAAAVPVEDAPPWPGFEITH